MPAILLDYKVINSALDNLLVSGGEIFIDFSIKRGVRKLPQSFFLVKVGPPNDQSAAFVGRFDNYIFALTKILKCRSLFRTKVGKFGVTIEIKFIDVMTAFIDKKNLKRRAGHLGESTSIFEPEASRKYLCPRVRIILFVMEKGFQLNAANEFFNILLN